VNIADVKVGWAVEHCTPDVRIGKVAALVARADLVSIDLVMQVLLVAPHGELVAIGVQEMGTPV
jgi:hypothetical protein